MTGNQQKKKKKVVFSKRLPSLKAKVLFADSEKDADMLYATKVFVPDPFLFFMVSGKKYIVIGDLEYSRIKREAQVDHVYSFREVMDLQRTEKKKSIKTADICKIIFQAKKIDRLEVPTSFPLGLADELRQRGFIVEAQPAPFFPGRAIKGEVEVAAISRALRATEHGLKVAAEALKEAKVNKKKGRELILGGQRLTAERMRSLIHKAILDKQCQANHTIVACGPQSYDPHQMGQGPLRADEPIIIDIFPRSDKTGYYGDMTRTFVKGKASEKILAMYHAVKKAQKYAVSQIVHGVQANRIHEDILQLYQQAGFPTQVEKGRVVGFFHGTGHGLGLDLHEYPSISTNPCRLRQGHIVTVEPGLYYPDVGGVRIEDVICVDLKGAKQLSRFPKYLEIGL